jgi:hypothetical protein
VPTITATTFTTEAYVRVDADWTDTPAVVYAGVQRTNTVTGEIVMLRPYVAYDGNGNLLLSCSKGVWWDTEPPLNVPLTYCLVASDVQTNFATNSSFELGTAPWTAFGGTLTQSGVFFHDGAFSGLFTPDGTSNNGGIQYPATTGFPFLADIPVTVSLWVYTPQGYNGFRISWTWAYTDGTTETVASNVEILDANEWRFMSVTATPKRNANFTSMGARATGIAPAATLFYVDQFTFNQARPATTPTCTTVTVTDTTHVRLKDPLNPCNDLTIGLCSPIWGDCPDDTRISYAGQAADTRPPSTLVIDPINRKFPIPVNRSRRSPRTELRLIAHDCAAADAVVAINEPGSPLLWQLPAAYCQEDRYISVGDETENRPSVDQREPFRLMVMPYITVERPSGPANGVCGARIQDLCDIYTSWTAMTAAALIWRDLLYGLASNNGPGQDPDALRTWDEVETEFASWNAVNTGGRTWDDLRDGL